jgi:hypothetical protein
MAAKANGAKRGPKPLGLPAKVSISLTYAEKSAIKKAAKLAGRSFAMQVRHMLYPPKTEE